MIRPVRRPLRRSPVKATAAAAVLSALVTLPGCITVNTLGGARQPLMETVVHGTSGPKVLLLDVDGVISDRDSTGPFGIGGSESTVARVREQLDKAAKDGQVEGLLLRVNSPGGTVTASDVVYRDIKAFKTAKDVPVVVQMMGVAASGGYYIAMAGDVVMAHPTTVTGSIGVISSGINFAGLMERYGVADQTITAGELKDAGSPLRPMTAEERAYLQAVIDDLHDRFREVVDEGRPALSAERVETLADGRVFTANQAEADGLIDGIGYLPDAVREMERRLDVSSLRLVSYHREREYRANYYSTSPAPTSQGQLAQALGLGQGPSFLYLWWPALTGSPATWPGVPSGGAGLPIGPGLLRGAP